MGEENVELCPAIPYPDTSLTHPQCCRILPTPRSCDPAILLFATTLSTYTCKRGEPTVPSVCKNGAFA